MKNISIAIDGPAGAGKSSVAKTVAKKLGIAYIDTGAMYRTIGLAAIKNGIDTKNKDGVLEKKVNDIDIDVRYIDGVQHMYLDGEDVSDKIRENEVSMAASDVAAIGAVRLRLVDIQRELAKKQSVIMDGRDIGTYVLPKADVKIYLSASVEARAKRRYNEIVNRGDKADYQEILEDIKKRDYNDSHRSFAPLKKADDAVLIDTTELSFDESADAVYRCIMEKF